MDRRTPGRRLRVRPGLQRGGYRRVRDGSRRPSWGPADDSHHRARRGHLGGPGRASAQAQSVSLGAEALFGITTALVLALPQDPQPLLLAAVVALAGLVVGLVAWWLAGDRLIAIAGACAVWVAWAALRLESDSYDSDLVENQMALLAALVGLVAFAAAWWMPAAGWVGAVLGFVAMLVHPGTPRTPSRP